MQSLYPESLRKIKHHLDATESEEDIRILLSQ